jgi:hypothetical protein
MAVIDDLSFSEYSSVKELSDAKSDFILIQTLLNPSLIVASKILTLI